MPTDMRMRLFRFTSVVKRKNFNAAYTSDLLGGCQLEYSRGVSALAHRYYKEALSSKLSLVVHTGYPGRTPGSAHLRSWATGGGPCLRQPSRELACITGVQLMTKYHQWGWIGLSRATALGAAAAVTVLPQPLRWALTDA
jgi:hypothetical protein